VPVRNLVFTTYLDELRFPEADKDFGNETLGEKI